MTHTLLRPGSRARRAGLLPLAAAVLALVGCDLDVDTPTIVAPAGLRDSTALPTLVAGVAGDFAIAYAGNDDAGDEGLILVGGLRADEWLNRDTFEERRDIDLGTMRTDNGSLRDLFRNVQRARRSAEFAADQFRTIDPAAPGLSQVLSYGGVTYVLLAENFCSGAPISDLSDAGEIAYGEPRTTEQLFTAAVAKFDSALTVASRTAADATLSAAARAQGTSLANYARVGRARALVGLGRYADAASTVSAVPTAFVFNAEFSENSARQNNAVFTFNNIRRRWGVANREGTNGLDFVAAADPRVRTATSTRTGLDGVRPNIVNQLKFADRSASIPIASGVEARLIEAEAALKAGQTATFLSIHNALRATVTGLGPLTEAGLTQQQLEDTHFRERAFWLFATAHRLGDLRRLTRPVAQGGYGRSVTQTFPQGTYFKSPTQYGTQTSLIIPLEEENNPNFSGCAGTP